MKRFPVILAMMLALFPMLGALSETAPQTREGTIIWRVCLKQSH
jgi:hypothetical protein